MHVCNHGALACLCLCLCVCMQVGAHAHMSVAAGRVMRAPGVFLSEGNSLI